MRVQYKGKLDALVPAQEKKLQAKLDKLARYVDGKEEREVHFVVDYERHEHHAEITASIRDHILVGAGSSPDLLTAMSTAIDKLEKQVRRLRNKWRDTHRSPEQSLRVRPVEEPEPITVSVGDEELERQVFRVNHYADQKPLTLEEALLALEDGRDYIVYRDAETDGISVLLRRRDGHFDLVEA